MTINAVIPEGYTYKRCDLYTKAEFLKRYADQYRFSVDNELDIAREYVRNHPKQFYDTDDQIAVHNLMLERKVNPIYGGDRHTTKRYDDE